MKTLTQWWPLLKKKPLSSVPAISFLLAAKVSNRTPSPAGPLQKEDIRLESLAVSSCSYLTSLQRHTTIRMSLKRDVQIMAVITWWQWAEWWLRILDLLYTQRTKQPSLRGGLREEASLLFIISRVIMNRCVCVYAYASFCRAMPSMWNLYLTLTFNLSPDDLMHFS